MLAYFSYVALMVFLALTFFRYNISQKARSRKVYVWTHSALSDWSGLGRPEKATAQAIAAPPSAAFI
jgi:hypothetical protein